MSATLKLHWETMAIHRVSWREKLTDFGVAKGTLVLDDGTTIVFPRIVIPKTPVRLIHGVWVVNACMGFGDGDQGSKISVSLPPEPCGLSLETGGIAALSVPYTCEVTLADGRVFKGDLIPPDCALHLLPLYAEELDMEGVPEPVVFSERKIR